ncbi:hypothetical protein DSECCO2_581380 [anaerobic digester metagenome]
MEIRVYPVPGVRFEQLVGGGSSQEADRRAVDVDDPVVHLDVNGVGGVVNEGLEVLLGLDPLPLGPDHLLEVRTELLLLGGELVVRRLQLSLRPLPLGDVPEEDEDRRSAAVRDRLRGDLDRGDLPRGREQPPLRERGRPPFFGLLPEELEHLFLLVRVDEPEDVIEDVSTQQVVDAPLPGEVEALLVGVDDPPVAGVHEHPERGEIDERTVLLLALAQGVLGRTPLHELPDLVGELGEQGRRCAALLEVEVRAAVDRLDHDLLAPPAREEDERGLPVALPDLFEKRDPVHAGHLVVRDDDIVCRDGKGRKGLVRRFRRVDRELPHPLQREAGHAEKVGLIVDVEDADGPWHRLQVSVHEYSRLYRSSMRRIIQPRQERPPGVAGGAVRA